MMKSKTFFLPFLLLAAALKASAGVPATLPVEGRLTLADGTPLLLANTQIRIQIRSPGVENCLLYSEIFSGIDLSTSGGRFAIQLNSGAGTVETSYGWTFVDVFKNTGTLNTGAPNCTTGSSYSPNLDDSRKVQIYVFDGTSWDPFPAYSLNSTPFSLQAGNAQTVGNLPPSSLLQTDTTTGWNLSQTNLKSLFTDANWAELTALISGTSTRYAASNSGNITLSAQKSLQMGRFTAAEESTFVGSLSASDNGKTWFNSTTGTLKYWNGSAVVAATAGNVGDFLKDGSLAMTGPFRSMNGTMAAPGMTFSSDPDTGVFSPGANSLGVSVGGVARLNITPVGDVAMTGGLSVGTTMPPAGGPFYLFSNSDPGPNYGDAVIHNDAITGVAGPSLQFVKSRSGIGPATANDIAGRIKFTGFDSAYNWKTVADITSHITNVTSGASAGNLKFGTMSANTLVTRMFIDSNGNVGIGTTTPAYLLHLSTDSAAKPGTGTWTVASDLRLKNIRAPFTRGLESLEGLQTIYFRYKANNPLGLPSDKEYVGIKAQDAKRSIPEAVSTDENGYLHLNNDAIIWTIVNSVKELYHRWTNENEEVHRQIDELKARNAEFEARLQRLEALAR